jgi:hypothetical protein
MDMLIDFSTALDKMGLLERSSRGNCSLLRLFLLRARNIASRRSEAMRCARMNYRQPVATAIALLSAASISETALLTPSLLEE